MVQSQVTRPMVSLAFVQVNFVRLPLAGGECQLSGKSPTATPDRGSAVFNSYFGHNAVMVSRVVDEVRLRWKLSVHNRAVCAAHFIRAKNQVSFGMPDAVIFARVSSEELEREGFNIVSSVFRISSTTESNLNLGPGRFLVDTRVCPPRSR
jgi:hypothetical protein